MLSGCYEVKIMKAYEKLEVGMNKEQVNTLFENLKFINERVVFAAPGTDIKEERGSIQAGNHIEYIAPKNLIDRLTFDGNIKVYSYLISKKKKGLFDDYTYAAIFYDTTNDRVIGKAIISTFMHPKDWRKNF